MRNLPVQVYILLIFIIGSLVIFLLTPLIDYIEFDLLGRFNEKESGMIISGLVILGYLMYYLGRSKQ